MILKDAYTNNYFTELWSLIAAATLILYIYMYILSYLKINRGPPPLMGIYPLNFVIDYVKLYILYINAWFNRLYLEFENCNVKTDWTIGSVRILHLAQVGSRLPYFKAILLSQANFDIKLL